MALFGRLIEIEVGKPGTIGRTFSEFRITFDITKTEYAQEANPCKVQIFNLSENLRSYIFAEKQKIIVRAGYLEESGLEVIYIGDITSREVILSGPDIITVIDSGDGAESLKKSKVSMSFNPGATGDQLLQKTVDSFQLPKKTNINLIDIPKKVFNNGFSYMGSSPTVMNKLCKNLDLTWSIQNEELKIYRKFNNDKSLAINLNPNTGLLGIPTKTKITIQGKEVDGWNLDCLLLPKAEPGGLVLVSSSVTGDNKKFKIITTKHVGDNIESDFKTNLQVVEL